MPILKNESEKQFQKRIVLMAEQLGYAVYHTPDSRRVTANGFPDLVLGNLATGKMFALELKSQKGKARANQYEWLAMFQQNGVDAHIVRPSDEVAIRKLLVNGARKEKSNA